jgi:hypothetical protein
MAPHLCIVSAERCSMPRGAHVAGILVGVFRGAVTRKRTERS